MIDTVYTLLVYMISFVVSFYALQSIRYEKFLPIQKTREIMTLHVLLSIGLSYLVAQWVLTITSLRF